MAEQASSSSSESMTGIPLTQTDRELRDKIAATDRKLGRLIAIAFDRFSKGRLMKPNQAPDKIDEVRALAEAYQSLEYLNEILPQNPRLRAWLKETTKDYQPAREEHTHGIWLAVCKLLEAAPAYLQHPEHIWEAHKTITMELPVFDFRFPRCDHPFQNYTVGRHLGFDDPPYGDQTQYFMDYDTFTAECWCQPYRIGGHHFKGTCWCGQTTVSEDSDEEGFESEEEALSEDEEGILTEDSEEEASEDEEAEE